MRLVALSTILVLLPLGAIACKDATAPRVAVTLDRNAGENQRGFAGGTVEKLVSVVVRDRSGAPLDGVTVRFTVTSGQGSIAGSEIISGPYGLAIAGPWTLGPIVGSNTILVTADQASVEFHAQSIPVPHGNFELVAVGDHAVPIKDEIIFSGVVLSGTIALNENATFSQALRVRDEHDDVTTYRSSGGFFPGSPDGLRLRSNVATLDGNFLNVWISDGEFSQEKFTFVKVSS
jgi:hypothetical protein